MTILDLLGPYCVNRIIYMSCFMSSWDDTPTIRYIHCCNHVYVIIVTRAFPALSSRNVRH